MTARRPRRRRVAIEVRSSTIVLRGWRVDSLAEEAGLRPVYSGASGGWLADRSRLNQLLAYLERRHVAHVVDDPDQGDLDLFGGATR